MSREPSNLIPADQALAAGAVPFNFNDVRALAAGLLRKTKTTCEKMLADARAQVADMEKRARTEGLDKGRAEGLAKGEEEGRKKGLADGQKRVAEMVEAERAAFQESLAPAAASLSAFMAEAEQWRAALLAQAEADLLRLSMDIARRVVGVELALHPEAVAAMLREAVALTTRRADIDVYANPEDVAVLEAELPELRAAFPDLGSVRFTADPRIERGGVVSRTRETEVDLQLATRLSAFEQALLGVSGPDAQAPWNRVQATDPSLPGETASDPSAAVAPDAPVATEERTTPEGAP